MQFFKYIYINSQVKSSMYIYLQYCYNQNQYQAVDELGAIYQKYKYI